MSSTTPTPPKSLLPLEVLFDNPVFAGGVGLAGLGAAATFGRRWVVSGAGLLKRRLLVDVEISKQDESYPYAIDSQIP
jgi:chaperone BCS1